MIQSLLLVDEVELEDTVAESATTLCGWLSVARPAELWALVLDGLGLLPKRLAWSALRLRHSALMWPGLLQ